MANSKSVIINLVANDRVSGALKGVGKSFDKLNGQMKQAAAPAAAAAGAAAGAALVGGISDAIKLDSARGKLEAQLGLTKGKSKEVGQVAGKLYSSAYGESMEEVQGAITSVIQNMDGMRTASNATLQQTTARAMDVATVMDEEVGATTRAVAQMMKTGLAKNSQEAFDILVAGTQRGANKAQDLLDTFNEYGTQFRKLGLDGKTAMGLIQQGLQGGARDADIVADAFKEFSIRAIDGSDSTAAGFKALGLNATSMAKQIAAGGPTASKGLDQVLDRLRAVKDPTKQAQIAVALFGTQAEDLGKALFTLDPSKAVQSLGQVGGAADKAGQALGGTTQAKFEAFKRSLTQDVTGALMSTIGFFQKHTTTTKVLAGAVATLTAAYVTYNAVALTMAARTALMTSGTAANTIVTGVAKVATLGWAAATWVLNAAMAVLTSPITAVVVAIGLIIAAVVLAYKHNETFRNVVNAVWNGVKTAVMTAWNFIKPIFMQIASVLVTVVGTALRWYWAYVKFVFTTVWTIIQTAWALIKPIFSAIAAVVRGVLGVAFIVFRNLIKVVWIAIQIYIKIAWTIIKTIFAGMRLYITGVLAPIFRWLWNSVIRPVWNGIRAAISVAWGLIKAIWNSIRTYLSATLAPAFRTFKAAATTAWNGLRSAISTATGGIKNVFDGLKTAVGKVRDAFRTAVDSIGRIWGGLKELAKKPVNFIIGLYNDGIVSLVNKLAGFAGIKGSRLDKIPKFERGGVMPGYAPGRDSLLAAVSPGESIFRPEFTRAVGSNWVTKANAVARSGGPGAVRSWLTGGDAIGGEGLAFARGGVVPGFAGRFGLGGIVGGFIKGMKDFAFGNVEKAASGVLGKILGGTVPGSGIFRDMVAAIPKWIKDLVLKWIKDKVGAGGGPGMSKALAWAKTQAGKPYVWGGVGPGGYDCSGWTSALTNIIQGRPPHSRRHTTHSFGASGPDGFVRNKRSGFMVGVTDAGVGHMAGTLLGTAVESSGGAGVRVGGGARGATNGLFTRQYGLKADTGALALQPGWNPPTFNGTGRMEYLETPRRGGGEPHVHFHGPVGSRTELQNWLARAMDDLRRQGRM